MEKQLLFVIDFKISKKSLVKFSLFGIFIFSAFLLFFFYPKQEAKAQTEDPTWWNSSWQYRKNITIANPSSNNLINYNVSIFIDTASLISEGKMRNDCGDVRFTYFNSTDNNESEITSWWQEGACNSNTSYWITVPFIPANSQATIYIYYGNPDAVYNGLIWNGVWYTYTNSSTTPSDFNESINAYGRFLLSNNTFGIKGGSEIHNHTISGGTGGPSSTIGGDPSGTYSCSSPTHTHSFSVKSSNAPNYPPYYTLRLLNRTNYIYFKSFFVVYTNSTVPSDCYIFTPAIGYYILPNDTVGMIGGTTPHNHTFSGTTSTAGGDATAQGSTQGPGAHSHSYSGTTGNSLIIPRYYNMTPIYVPSDFKCLAGGITIMANSVPPIGWSLLGINNKFILSHSSTGGIGGGSHTHSFSFTTGGSPGGSCSPAAGSSSKSATGHTHSSSGTSSVESDDPPFFSVLYIVRNSDITTYSIGTEELPNKITNVSSVISFQPTEFINVSGTNLTLGGNPYRFVGMNSYYLVDYATNFTYDDDGNPINNSRKYVLEVLNEMHYLNLNVLRTWGGMECGYAGHGYSVWDCNNSGGHYNAFQKYTHGNWSEEMYQALDWLIYEAGKRDIRLALVLVNNWKEYGGMRWYVQQSPTTNKTWENITNDTDSRFWEFHDQFYNDTYAKQYFKDFINHTLWRNNTYTGRYYKDDPTIAMWVLANEPRAKSQGSNYTLIRNWAEEMANYIRNVDQKHIIALGIEGWGTPLEGTNFIKNQDLGNLSIATYNVNPYQWDWFANRSEYATNSDWADEGWNSSKVIDWWTNNTSLSYNNRFNASNLPEYDPYLGRHGYQDWVRQHVNWSNVNLSKPVMLMEVLYPLRNGKVATDGSYATYALRTKFFNQTVKNFFDNGGDGLLFWVLQHDNYYWSTATSSYPGKMDDGFGFYLSDNATLRDSSAPVIDTLKWIRDTGYVTLLNNYKYNFNFMPQFSGEIKNATLHLKIGHENGTFYYQNVYNSTPVINNAINTIVYQFQRAYNNSDKNFTYIIEVCSDTCLNTTESDTTVLWTTKPVPLLLTANNTQTTYNPSDKLVLSYNVTSDLDVAHCSLFLDGVENKTEYTPDIGKTLNFSIDKFPVGTHSWYVECVDIDSNTGDSEVRYFTINKASSPVKIFVDNVEKTNSTVFSELKQFNITGQGTSYLNQLEWKLYKNESLVATQNVGSDNVQYIFTPSPNPRPFSILFVFNTTGNENHTSNSSYVNLTITGAPKWLDNKTSIPSMYDPNKLSIFNITWNDSLGYSIDTVLFESNFSGTPKNYTMTLIDPYINATEKKGVYNYNNTLQSGIFYWKSYANASDGTWNSSDTWYFTIEAPPIWANQSQQYNIVPWQGTNNLSVYVYDNVGLSYAWLATNETGIWENKTVYLSPINLGGIGGTWLLINFTWQNNSLPRNYTVSWRVYFNDTAGNENVTDVMTFRTSALGQGLLSLHQSLSDVIKRIQFLIRTIQQLPIIAGIITRQIYLARTILQSTNTIISLIVVRIPYLSQVINISDLVSKQSYLIRSLSQNIASILTLTVVRIPYLEQIVSIATQVSRAISLIRELWIKHIVSTIIYLIPPVRAIFELSSPPYSYFEFFTHLENVVLLLIVIGAIATISSVYIWRHRKEVWKRPKQKYEEALKS